MSYVLTDPKKREHVAADSVEVDRLLTEWRRQFGASFKFKIRVNRDDHIRGALDTSGPMVTAPVR